MHITTDAVVLRAYDNGKNSKLLLLLTREHGRIAAVARGAGSLRSVLCAASGQFCYASFSLTKNADQYFVDTAEVQELFFELRQDIVRLSAGQYMLECAGGLARENEGDEQLLRVLLNSLYALAKRRLDPSLCKAVFELKCIKISGYMPDISGCIACGMQPDGGDIDFAQGRMGFEKCVRDKNRYFLDGQALEVLGAVFAAPISRMFSFKVSGLVMGRLVDFAERYFLAQTELAPKTLSFFKSLL